jgi:lysozyme family protein
MGNFNEAVHLTAINEGSFSNDPRDNGGLTWAGIASKFWGAWKGWPIVRECMSRHNGGRTPADVKAINAELRANAALTQLTAGFYQANFWNVNRLSDVADNQVADNLYDSGVNQGTGEAAHILQDSINMVHPKSVISDGAIGPKTIAAANAIDPATLNKMINLNREASYRRDKDWPIYGKVWVSRLKDYVKH